MTSEDNNWAEYRKKDFFFRVVERADKDLSVFIEWGPDGEMENRAFVIPKDQRQAFAEAFDIANKTLKILMGE